MQIRESTTTYGGGSGSGIHPHRSTVSASPASDFAGGGGGIFGGSGVSSAGSVTSGPPPVSRHGATVIEMWLAEPYQVRLPQIPFNISLQKTFGRIWKRYYFLEHQYCSIAETVYLIYLPP